MVKHRFALTQALLLGLFLSCCSLTAVGQDIDDEDVKKYTLSNTLEHQVRPGAQRVTMEVNSSKILKLEGKQIPRALVNDPEVVNAIAISPNQIQLSGLKAGVTQINLWDDDGNLYTVDLIVYGDARLLEHILEAEFPNSSLRIRPLASSLVISGWVDGPEVVSNVIKMAEDFFPKVINNIRVGDNQQVQLHVQVMEVSRTKLRQLGIDWGAFGVDNFVTQRVGDLITETTTNAGTIVGQGAATMTFGLANDDSSFFGVIEALRQHDLVKVLAEPVLTTVSGRPAAFNAGGEFPILIPQGLGTIAVEYKTFGTRVDFVPTVLGNGNIRLEVRPQVSEIDSTRGVELQGITVPGLVDRWVDTAVEMRAGQTLALAGLIQERVESQNRGVPVLSDLPWAGSLFRRVVERSTEVELLVMVRPEFVDGMDPHEVPMFGPGEHTTKPSDKELYVRGYLEVPTCCPDGSCRSCRAGRGQFSAERISQQLQMGSPTSNGLPMGAIPMNGGMTPMPVQGGPNAYQMPGTQIIHQSVAPTQPVANPATTPTSVSVPDVPKAPHPQAAMPFGMRAPTNRNAKQARPTLKQAMNKVRRMAGKSQLSNR